MKSRPNDENIKSSLYFMLAAMHAMKKKNQLSESFLVQLDIDLEVAGLDDMRDLSSDAVEHKYRFSPGGVPLCSSIADPQNAATARLAPLTFGNSGIALHSTPKATDNHVHPGKWMNREWEVGTSETINGNSMPVRQKSMSSLSRDSPQTLSSPEMDISSGSGSGSGSNSNSNGPTPPAAGRGSYSNGIFAKGEVSFNVDSPSTFGFDTMPVGDLAGAGYGFSTYSQLGQESGSAEFNTSKVHGVMPVSVADLGSMVSFLCCSTTKYKVDVR